MLALRCISLAALVLLAATSGCVTTTEGGFKADRKEEVARLRAEDYQMSYALDILRGLGFLNGSTN